MEPRAKPDHYEPTVRATIVRYDGRPDECTLHPSDPDESSRLTEWITAKSGAYLALANCR